MSSFQGVGIEEFHCIQRFPHFMGEVPLYTEVSSFHGVGIERFHCSHSYDKFYNFLRIKYEEISTAQTSNSKNLVSIIDPTFLTYFISTY